MGLEVEPDWQEEGGMEEVGCLEAVVPGERKEEASWRVRPQSWYVPRSPTSVKVKWFSSQTCCRHVSFTVEIEERVRACHVCNLDVIALQIVATSSFHPANGGSLSANHIYGPRCLPATNTNIHKQLYGIVHALPCFSTLSSRCITNSQLIVGLGDMTVYHRRYICASKLLCHLLNRVMKKHVWTQKYSAGRVTTSPNVEKHVIKVVTWVYWLQLPCNQCYFNIIYNLW